MIRCNDYEVTWENPSSGDQPYSWVTGVTLRIPVDREHRFRLIVNINSSRS